MKLQSAMEYLMTYGWAILIIAIVLAALYALGVFNGTAFSGESCIASFGASCKSIITGPGFFRVTLGQDLTHRMYNITYAFIPQSIPLPTTSPNSIFDYPKGSVIGYSTTGYIIPLLEDNGETATVFFNSSHTLNSVPAASTNSISGNLGNSIAIPKGIGTTTSGEIWEIYNPVGGSVSKGPFLTEEVGHISIKIN